MRISDWSSDVCSSDLLAYGRHDIIGRQAALRYFLRVPPHPHGVVARAPYLNLADARHAGQPVLDIQDGVVAQIVHVVAVVGREIGSASCRESVCKDVWISVFALSLKNNQQRVA